MSNIKIFQNELDKQFKSIGKIINLDTLPSGCNRIGVGMECLDRDLWDPFPAMPQLKKLGIRRVRLQSGWGRTEQKKGVYDFSWLDKIVDAALETGVDPWISLSYGNFLYLTEEGLKWLKNAMMRLFDNEEELEEKLHLFYGQGHNPVSSEEGMTAWLNYVAALVSRYCGKVTHIEIWNEPEVMVFFPSQSWLDDYMELVRKTVPVIRANNPDAKIVGGCGGRNMRMEQLLGKGIADYVDIFSFHGYHEFPEKFGVNAYRAYRTVLDSAKPGMPLWRGEAGCPSENPKGSHGALHHVKVTEDFQACWVGRNIINDLAMKELDYTSYFHLYDFEHFTRKYRYHYGILREDYTQKPSFGVLQFCAKLLDGNTVPADDLLLTLETGEENEQVNTVIRSFRRNGAPVFAYWIADGEKEAMRKANFIFWAAGTSGLERPVAIDVLTRKVYSLDLKDANILKDIPIAPYPLLLAEYSTFADVIALDGTLEEAQKVENHSAAQRFEA